MEVDDASVADRLAGLNQDAAFSWRDPAYLKKLGRTAVEELRYQGERRGWEPTKTDARVRGSLSDLYAEAVEAAIGQDDLDGAAALYDHARVILAPERQAAIDRRFMRAHEVALYRDIDRDLAGLPIEPAGPPGRDAFETRAAELTPEDATDEMRARITKGAEHAHRYAERQWQKQQADAGMAAFDWIGKNPGRSFLAIPPDVRDWLAPDQRRGLETLALEGRLKTDGDLFETLDRQMIYEPDAFASVDLDRYRLSLGDEDRARFAGAQKAIAEGQIDPGLARYDRLRRGIDQAVKALNVDADGPAAVEVRADARDRLKSFEIIEGRPPNGRDIDAIVDEADIDGILHHNTALDADDAAEGDREEAPIQPSDPDEVVGRASIVGAERELTIEGNRPAIEADVRSDEVALESASTFAADNRPTDDSPAHPLADDPNIIRVAGGANSSRRGGGGRPLTPNEQIRATNFYRTLDAIRELEPNNRELSSITTHDWVPSHRDVARIQEELLRAKARAAGETSAIPIGPYARESIPATRPGNIFSAEERREVDRIGNQHGCHTCGTITPGSKLGRWVPDHQPPSALSRPGESQRLYPQCLSCSLRQGGQVMQQRKREGESQ